MKLYILICGIFCFLLISKSKAERKDIYKKIDNFFKDDPEFSELYKKIENKEDVFELPTTQVNEVKEEDDEYSDEDFGKSIKKSFNARLKNILKNPLHKSLFKHQGKWFREEKEDDDENEEVNI